MFLEQGANVRRLGQNSYVASCSERPTDSGEVFEAYSHCLLGSCGTPIARCDAVAFNHMTSRSEIRALGMECTHQGTAPCLTTWASACYVRALAPTGITGGDVLLYYPCQEYLVRAVTWHCRRNRETHHIVNLDAAAILCSPLRQWSSYRHDSVLLIKHSTDHSGHGLYRRRRQCLGLRELQGGKP